MQDAQEAVAGRLQAAMVRRGWSQADLARASGIDTGQVSRALRGDRDLRLSTLLPLLAALEVSADEVLWGERVVGRSAYEEGVAEGLRRARAALDALSSPSAASPEVELAAVAVAAQVEAQARAAPQRNARRA